jgi:hypothetical protein
MVENHNLSSYPKILKIIYLKKSNEVMIAFLTILPTLNGPDGIFDSGKISPGKFFVQKFAQTGEFPYYCTIHPWRAGLVSVVSGHSHLPNLGSDFGDGSNVFDLKYKFNRPVVLL